MDLSNISKIIKKINRLYDIVENIGEASQTEKDLLKAYIVDLYEAVAITPDSKDLEKEEMLRKIKKQRKAEKKLKKLLEKETAKAETRDKEENKHEDPNVNGEEKLDKEVKSEMNDADAIPAELLELFQFDEATELSDKLGRKPITDLTKAMGINEKIFTINELFGGNKDEFENMLVALNGLDSFDQAKDVLMHSVAKKHSWQNESKLKKARNFIKLVHRRFN